MSDNLNQSIRLAAVGDLMLNTPPQNPSQGRGVEAIAAPLKDLLRSCDIVLANLECTLPGKEKIPTEPRVFTTEEKILKLPSLGINAVTLANNHTLDSGIEGFHRLTALLDQMKIPWCGAGGTLEEASRPLLLEINSVRIAIMGAVTESTGMSHFADANTPGVPLLKTESLCRDIEALARQVDHVLISPHWGEERFRIPRAAQIKQAHAFIDAGASMVIGHHPHVVQGVESYKNASVAYSLGNFLANPVYWENGDRLTWNDFERTSFVLLAEFDKQGLLNLQQIPIFDDGKMINIDTAGHGQRTLNRANKALERGATPARYRYEAFRVRTLLPLRAQLRWGKLRSLRPQDIGKVARLFKRGIS